MRKGVRREQFRNRWGGARRGRQTIRQEQEGGGTERGCRLRDEGVRG